MHASQVLSDMQVIAEMGVGDVQRPGVKSWERMGTGPGQGNELTPHLCRRPQLIESYAPYSCDCIYFCV